MDGLLVGALMDRTLANEGFVAWDSAVGEEVTVMVVVLCFLGDSPMHAEISNTKIPGTTLTPCRTCDLRVETRDGKCTERYVQDFIGIDENGDKVSWLH